MSKCNGCRKMMPSSNTLVHESHCHNDILLVGWISPAKKGVELGYKETKWTDGYSLDLECSGVVSKSVHPLACVPSLHWDLRPFKTGSLSTCPLTSYTTSCFTAFSQHWEWWFVDQIQIHTFVFCFCIEAKLLVVAMLVMLFLWPKETLVGCKVSRMTLQQWVFRFKWSKIKICLYLI